MKFSLICDLFRHNPKLIKKSDFLSSVSIKASFALRIMYDRDLSKSLNTLHSH